MTRSRMLRPDWTPATIALMVLGFVVFWPLGLAMLGYILFGDRLHQAWDENRGSLRGADSIRAGCRRSMRKMSSSGNVAFDEFRAAEIQRLEDERRKLDEMRDEFDAHLRELRRAKDKEEFDAFLRSRAKPVDAKGDLPGDPAASTA